MGDYALRVDRTIDRVHANLQSTKVDTVNRALAEIAARPRRLAALERLRTTADDLGDAEIMRGAWR